ncbi:kinase-like domain-containing protein [Stachybotrys elegans]|uniref:Kinase-like domain-containing protein n=1 Tax=Stachybotrys elegans TaxID=80388 RepID=A0A8K0SKR4_9HYPO|nr:kinase-like domain-containing protein [Stachybotrys elegans]
MHDGIDGRLSPTPDPPVGSLRPTLRYSDTRVSVNTVNDLGLGAIPYTDGSGQGHTITSLGDILTVGQLRRRLGLHPCTDQTIEQSIIDKMDECWQRNHKESQYLPIGAFEQIFTIDAIKALVVEKYQELPEPVLLFIINGILGTSSRRRIVAILVQMGKFQHIHDFLREDISDSDFPLNFDFRQPKSIETSQGRVLEIRHSQFRTWTSQDLHSLNNYQQWFFVPFLDMRPGRLCKYIVHERIHLPWLKKKIKATGGGGRVYRIEIDPSHHNFEVTPASRKPVYFALKEIDPHDTEAYHRELQGLLRCCAQVHKEDHLVNLLLFFQRGSKHYFVFEWADKNLQEFWENPPRENIRSDSLWIAQQCTGIARAVRRIHGLATWQKEERMQAGDAPDLTLPEWGRHQDIKPKNILWTDGEDEDDNGKLVLSDLGLSRYHTLLSRSGDATADGWTDTYRGPETDIWSQTISQNYDIWSLGCVFLEFCVWHLEGYDAVVNFGFERGEEDRTGIIGFKSERFFNIVEGADGNPVGELKSSVSKCIERLRGLPDCTKLAAALLDLIETKMLLINPSDRGKSDLIFTEMSKILKMMQEEQEAGKPSGSGSEIVEEPNLSTTVGNLATSSQLEVDDPRCDESTIGGRTADGTGPETESHGGEQSETSSRAVSEGAISPPDESIQIQSDISRLAVPSRSRWDGSRAGPAPSLDETLTTPRDRSVDDSVREQKAASANETRGEAVPEEPPGRWRRILKFLTSCWR